jgi:hypothetical protein
MLKTLLDNIKHAEETDRFKPAIPESERPQTHSLDGAATGIKEPFVDLNNPSQYPVFKNRPFWFSSNLPAFNRSNVVS